MANSTAVHGNAIIPGSGVIIEHTPTGAIVKPNPSAAGVGSFYCAIPNPAKAPVTAAGIQVDAAHNLANVTGVNLYSGNALVATHTTGGNIMFPLSLSSAAVGNNDAGWCLAVNVHFLNAGSSLHVYSLAIQFP